MRTNFASVFPTAATVLTTVGVLERAVMKRGVLIFMQLVRYEVLFLFC